MDVKPEDVKCKSEVTSLQNSENLDFIRTLLRGGEIVDEMSRHDSHLLWNEE